MSKAKKWLVGFMIFLGLFALAVLVHVGIGIWQFHSCYDSGLSADFCVERIQRIKR